VLTLLSDPAAAAVPHQGPGSSGRRSPATPNNHSAPVAAVPKAKESLWQRLKGTIELIGGLIAIIGLGIGAWQYFKPSEEKLSAEEQFALAQQYLDGNSTEKNVKRGGELLEMAAEKGHVESMNSLGVYTRDGKAGRMKDYGEALKWFELAAEAGDANSLAQIGQLYEEGLGVEKDEGTALKYYRKAAEKGDSAGQYKMGEAYGSGNGVAQNYEEAFKWYLKAAEHGHNSTLG
jgi:TPR repeat protein